MKLTHLECQQIAAALTAFDGRREGERVVDRVELSWASALAMARNRRLLAAVLTDVDAARRAIIAAHTGGALEMKASDPAAAVCQADLAALDRHQVELDLARLPLKELEARDANRAAVAPLLAWLLPILEVPA